MEKDNEKTKLFAILLRRICDDVADFANNLYRLADGVGDEKNPEHDTLPYFLLNDDEKTKTQDYRSVDLGLPSGLKWADRNVGAASPESYGDYFMWGSTEPGTNKSCDWAHAPFNGGKETFGKAYFNANKSEWLTENGTLKPEYDAAHVNMGGSWRMPTSAELQELLDGTTRSVGELDGVRGMRFASKTNGNSIFIPFCGYRSGSDVYAVGYSGNAWSSSLDADSIRYSPLLCFYNSGDANIYGDIRYFGFVVRGVHE